MIPMNDNEEETDEIGFSTSRRSSAVAGQQITITRNSCRNLIAFWLLGLCNNFGYVVMLSAAKDILEKSSDPFIDTGCIKDDVDFKCSMVSTGAVLLADILPSLTIKLFAPFFFQRITYLTRHYLVIIFQASSYLIVAYSETIFVGLTGVVFASLGAGLGEVTYLSLSSHFHNDAVSSWSSGTGGAGIFGALAFATLTDHRLLALSPQHALLSMLLVPFVLMLTYTQLLQCPVSVASQTLLRQQRQQRWADSSATETPTESLTSSADDLQSLLARNERENQRQSFRNLRLTWKRKIRPLLKYMIPLTIVYFSEYFINQGLLELLVFDCGHSFDLSPMQQYRWYQVLYQFGVFLSRSSVRIFPIRPVFIPLLALLQVANAVSLFGEAFRLHIPHLLLMMLVIFYEGLLGGAAYVNTFSAIHRTVSKTNREFSLAFVSISDSIGIVLAGFFAIYAHNFICAHR